MNQKTLTKRDYENALQSQNACNLSGVAHSLSEVLPRIWNESNGTTEVNQHPIVRLYIEQMAFLANRDYFESEKICRERAE